MYRPIRHAKTNSSRTTSQVTRPDDSKAIGTCFHALLASLRAASLILAWRIAVPLLLLTAGMVVVQPAAGQSGIWIPTGSLITERAGHRAALLPNGEVLIAGGVSTNSVWLASAELYDSGTEIWTATGSLATPRSNHTATLLPNGEVLVTGGRDSFFTDVASAELYDSATATWTATGSLVTARDAHTTTLLPNGRVLAAGGYNSTSGYLASAELYKHRRAADSGW